MFKKFFFYAKMITITVLPFVVSILALVSIVLGLRFTVFAPKLEIHYTKVRSPTVVKFDTISAKDIRDYAMYSPTSKSNLNVTAKEVMNSLEQCKVGKYNLNGQDLLKDLEQIRRKLEPIPKYDINGDPIYSTFIYKVISNECYCNILYNDKGVFIEVGDNN